MPCTTRSACASTRRRSRPTRCSRLSSSGARASRRAWGRTSCHSSRSRSRGRWSRRSDSPRKTSRTGPSGPTGPSTNDAAPGVFLPRPRLRGRRGEAHGRSWARGDARGGRHRSLSQYDAAPVRAVGARWPSRYSRHVRRARLVENGPDHRRGDLAHRRVVPSGRGPPLFGPRHRGGARVESPAQEYGHARRQRLRRHALQLLQPVLRVAQGRQLLHEEGRRHLPRRPRQLALLGGVLLRHRAHALEPGRPGEVLTDIVLPPCHGWRSAYLKLRRRGSFDFPVLGVAVALRMDGETVREAAITLGAVASQPRPAPEAAALLVGQRLTPELIAAVADAAFKPGKPLDNTDLTHPYRKKMIRVFVARALYSLAHGQPASTNRSNHLPHGEAASTNCPNHLAHGEAASTNCPNHLPHGEAASTNCPNHLAHGQP